MSATKAMTEDLRSCEDNDVKEEGDDGNDDVDGDNDDDGCRRCSDGD